MKWIKDKYTDSFICPKCEMMVGHNGYGGCDFQFCPYCGTPVEPVKEAERNAGEMETLLGNIKAYYRSDSECKEYKCADCIHFDECGQCGFGKQHPDGYKWRFEDAVNALLGGLENDT